MAAWMLLLAQRTKYKCKLTVALKGTANGQEFHEWEKEKDSLNAFNDKVYIAQRQAYGSLQRHSAWSGVS